MRAALGIGVALLLIVACGRAAAPRPASAPGASPSAKSAGTATSITTVLASSTPAPPSTSASAARPAEGSPASGGTPATAASTPAAVTNAPASKRIDLSRLPIGDGRVTASPRAGNVYACPGPAGGGGAFRDGPWIRGDGTFDLTAKIAVAGSLPWSREFSITASGATRTITGNGLPAHATGQFPVQASDPAAQYDRNPNSIRAISMRYAIPAHPSPAAAASCVGLGPIGVTLNGVVFFNALDALRRDAVAHEVLDACGGHPERTGQYHYHDQSPCIDDSGSGHSPLIGYALDGFGLFGHRGESGAPVTDDDLDECHGHTHAIPWDGGTVAMYHYHTTYEYPYAVGCFRGTPVR